MPLRCKLLNDIIPAAKLLMFTLCKQIEPL